MKKVLAIFIAAALVVGMCAACGSTTQATTAAAPETTAAPATTQAPETTPAMTEEAPSEMADGEAPADAPEGEVPAEVPASGTTANSAHGQQTADEDGYKLYLKEWLDAEDAANDTMNADQVKEFMALIEAGNYTDFPVDMLYSGMLVTGIAMTLDEFIKAGGIY